MFNKQEFAKRWQAMPTKKRGILVAVVGGALVIVLGVLFGAPAPVAGNAAAQKKASSNFNLPVNRDLSMEQLAANLESVNKRLMDETTARARLEAQLKDEKKKGENVSVDPLTGDVVREMREMRLEIDNFKAQMATQRNEVALDAQLPPVDSGVAPVMPGSSVFAEPQHEVPQIRITGGLLKEQKKDASNAPQQDEVVYLPVGSNFEGVLMNGMDAPTSGSTKQNPVPALIRLDTDAILPNRHRFDVRECFTIVSGFGVLSTERAQLQTITISCVKESGEVIESKMEGYVVGEDGKVGLRGRLVTKQGQLLAKSFTAGFFSGIGQALAPISVPQLNTTPGDTSQYQAPNLSQVATSATAQGLQRTARDISKFYLDMASEMFPIIEIDAMRRVTVILTKGVELSMAGGSK